MKTEHFRKKLEEEKVRLESEMGGIGRRNPAVPDDWEAAPAEASGESDMVDQADVVTSRETNLGILADLEARYATILAALERLKKGKYGTCEVCGKKIEVARLEADPTATTCTKDL